MWPNGPDSAASTGTTTSTKASTKLSLSWKKHKSWKPALSSLPSDPKSKKQKLAGSSTLASVTSLVITGLTMQIPSTHPVNASAQPSLALTVSAPVTQQIEIAPMLTTDLGLQVISLHLRSSSTHSCATSAPWD